MANASRRVVGIIDVRLGVLGKDPEETASIAVPAILKKFGNEARLIVKAPGADVHRGPDTTLLNLLAKAHDWFGRLASGASRGIAEIAYQEGVSNAYASRVTLLAMLAPDIVQKIVRQEHPLELTAERVIRLVPLPEDWGEQRKLLGVA